MQELTNWLSAKEAKSFPFEAVVREFQRTGKHFVDPGVLDALEKVRASSRTLDGGDDAQLLDKFLNVTLDKRDGRYDYVTYLALDLLPIPLLVEPKPDVDSAIRLHDRLIIALLADELAFETAAANERTSALPELRPDSRTVSNRIRHGLSRITPVYRRLGLGDDVVEKQVHEIVATVLENLTTVERRALRISMLPVDLVHDEYLFIRVLQAFETSFALMAVELVATMDALAAGEPSTALHFLVEANSALRESVPLFSMLATMQVESFQRFRQNTEGASAIQSRNYKLVESLCRDPDHSRVDSIAYRSVPNVRERVLAGNRNLDRELERAIAVGVFNAAEQEEFEEAMRKFATSLVRWRQTHYRLAVRMLGDRAGTGYTEGPPYLKAVRTIPVFESF